MAGMFYSLEETASKLQKSEDELHELVKEGKLREFRDGPNLLFKVDEVESLIPEGQSGNTPESAQPEQPQEDSQQQEQAQEQEPQLDDTGEQQDAEDAEETVEMSLADTSEPKSDESESSDEFIVEDTSEPEAEDESEQAGLTDEILLNDTSQEQLAQEEHEEEAAESNEDIILDDAESREPSAQTAEEGVEVLSESDTDYDLSADTSAETSAGESGDISLESSGSFLDTGKNSLEEGLEESGLSEESEEKSAFGSDGASLEEIEEDVNLDSFGSGSGLLDLSLQADDTSLGGILDEIYTPEEEEKQQSSGSASVMAVAGEAEEMTNGGIGGLDSDLQPQVMAALMEPEPDTISNALGGMLFLPLIAVVLTALVTVAGLAGVKTGLLATIQGVIWYVVIGMIVVSLAAVGIPVAMSGEASGKTKTKARPKKSKALKKSKANKKAEKEAKKKAKAEKKPRKKKKKK